jgi:pyruvate/2-oxoglutarate dehydrogenase complex dihydrolipoamide dehydrogenase (E3) component
MEKLIEIRIKKKEKRKKVKKVKVKRKKEKDNQVKVKMETGREHTIFIINKLLLKNGIKIKLQIFGKK